MTFLLDLLRETSSCLCSKLCTDALQPIYRASSISVAIFTACSWKETPPLHLLALTATETTFVKQEVSSLWFNSSRRWITNSPRLI